MKTNAKIVKSEKRELKKSRLFSVSLLVLLACFGTSSCSFKAENPADPGGLTPRAEAQDRERLKASFQGIEGTYKGTIDTSSGVSIPVEFGLFSVHENVGKNSRGETKIIPTLKARFRREDIISRYSISDVSYNSETGELLTTMFKNQTATPGGSSDKGITDPFSAQGFLLGGVYTARVTTSTGVLGTMKVSQTSQVVETDPAGESNEYRMALKEKLRVLAGKYVGKFSSLDGSRSIVWEIEVQILEGGAGDTPIPYVSIKEPSTGTIYGTLAIGEYRPETQPASFKFSNNILIFNGRIEGNGFVGLLNGPDLNGELLATKK